MNEFTTFVVNHWVLSSAFVVILVLLILNESKRKLLGYKDIAPNDAVQLMNRNNAVVLDVREDGEFAQGHILNAIHVPAGLVKDRIKELELYREQPVVVVCRSGQRSAHASTALQKEGFKQVYKLRGGMLAWESAGLPVTRRSAPAKPKPSREAVSEDEANGESGNV